MVDFLQKIYAACNATILRNERLEIRLVRAPSSSRDGKKRDPGNKAGACTCHTKKRDPGNEAGACTCHTLQTGMIVEVFHRDI